MSRPTPAPLRAVANTIGMLTFLVAAFPVYWMVNSSFLDRNEIRNPVPTWVPFGGDLDNFRTVFATDQFVNALRVSLMVTGLTIVVALAFAFVAAVAVSRFRFRGRMSFIVTLLVIQMIPVEGLFISQYKMLEAAELLNTVVGLTLVYVANVLPFTIWTLRGFVAGVPYELEEAAMMDGCSRVAGVLPGDPAAARARPGGDRCVRLHPGVERVHPRAGRDDARGPAHPAALALDLHRRQPRHRLGRDHGRLHAHRRARDHLLPRRAGADGQRTHHRGGEGR